MPKTYPVGTIREWQSGWVIKAHDPMQPFSGGWIPLKTSPQLEEIGINCDHLASSIKNYKLPINGEKFLDHEINEFRDDNGKKIFTADSFKKYEGFYGAGRYAFRNEFSRLFMQNDMQLKEEINSALVRANIEKGGDRKTCALTEEEKSKIRDSVKSTFKELNNPFTVDSANKLYGIVKRVKDQLEEGFDFKDASQKAVYEEFVNAADSIPIVYDKIKVKRELKNRMVSIIDEKFSNNWGVCESCKDYINKKFDEYVKKYSDQISKDTVDEQMERFGVTIDMEPNEFYQRIYDKIDVEIDKDDGSFKDLVYLRFLKKYGKSVDGNWSLNNLPALQNLENIILELPEGHFLKNDKIMLITNKDYSGGDSGGYAWYDSFDKRINLSSDCIEKGSVFGVLKDPDEFRATLFHEIGHSVSEKLGRNNFYDYRKFAVECGWTYQSQEIRMGVIATGDNKDMPRMGSNSDIRLITNYAHKSPEEAFAEYYSFYNLQKQDIDKFLDTGNDSFLKKNTVSEIDSAEGIVVGNSNISDRILDISSREYTEFKNTISELSHMYEHDKIELISPWGTVFTQSELQKFDKKNLKEIKDRNVQNMPPTVSYSKNGKNVIIDGITRVEACRMNKKGVPTITLSYELYKTLKDRGWSDITIANCAYTKYRNSQTPYQKKSEVKRYGMVYRHWFVPIETLKENVDVFRTMRKIYNSPELQKALLELFQKSADNGVSRGMSPNEIAERHGVSVKDIIAQLEIGVKIEMEHTSDKQEAKRIALDHLYELPDYYTRLEIMENQAKDGIPAHKIEISKSGNGILTIFTDVIEKARSGRYVDNSENRKLGRVGMTYGEYERQFEIESERRARERSEYLEPKYQEITNKISKELRKEGYYIKYVYKSSTQFGKSWYLKLDDDIDGDQIRISDHSVGERRYINDNTISYIDYRISDEDLGLRISHIIKYLKERDKRMLELQKEEEKRDIEFKNFDLRRNNFYDKLDKQGLGVSTMERTYQDIEVIKQKHPDWSNIYQETIDGGAFKYFYTKPKDPYTSKFKISKEYLDFLERNLFNKSILVNYILGIDGSAIELVNSFTEEELFEKARFGYYADNAENRRLKRVGQKYGTKKEEDQPKGKVKKIEDEESGKEINEYTDDDLAEFAKETADEDLKRASAGSNEKLRVIAKQELERRKTEHKTEDKQEKYVEVEDVSKEKEHSKLDSKFTELNKKYNLSRLPIGIPADKVEINEDTTRGNWILKWIDPKTEKQVMSYSKEFLQHNAKDKWNRIKNVSSKDISSIINNSKKLLLSEDNKEAQSAAIVNIIALTGLRPGSRKGFNETENRGVTTLAKENVKINGSKISFEFRGKSYKNNTAEIDSKPLVDFLKKLMEDKKDKDFLFDVDDKFVRMIFKRKISPKSSIKLKDMRTYIATDLARKILNDSKIPPPPIPKGGLKTAVKKKLTEVFKIVSSQLNNTPSMAKSSYVHPEVINGWLDSLGIELSGFNKSMELDELISESIDEEENEDVDEYPLPEWWGEDEDKEEE